MNLCLRTAHHHHHHQWMLCNPWLPYETSLRVLGFPMRKCNCSYLEGMLLYRTQLHSRPPYRSLLTSLVESVCGWQNPSESPPPSVFRSSIVCRTGRNLFMHNGLEHREEPIYLGHCTVPEENQVPPDCSPTLHRNRLTMLR